MKTGINITHPDRIITVINVSKKQLVEYYYNIAEFILPYITNRPLVVVRCPAGNKCFFQKHYTKSFGDTILSIPIQENNKTSVEPYLMIKNRAGLINLIQLSTVELHPWASVYKSIEKPDQITFDLDPDESVPWKQVIKTALLLKEILAQLNLQSFVKTSGGKGLHVVIPIKRRYSWEEIKEFSHAITWYMVDAYPEQYTGNPLKSKRKNKVFIDYLRNGRGATSVSAYSVKCRVGAPVSTPVTWQELTKIKSATQFTIFNMIRRMSKLAKDPWEEFHQCKQILPKLRNLQ